MIVSLPLQSILGEFNKEQEAFIKDQSGKDGDIGVCPWVGHGLNEDKIKEEIVSLSGVSLNLFIGFRDVSMKMQFPSSPPANRTVGISFVLRQPELILSSTTISHIQQRSLSWLRTRNWRKCDSILYLKCELTLSMW
jgi:hypothetical protein